MPLLDEVKTIDSEDAAKQFITKNWQAALPEEALNDSIFKTLKDPSEIFKSWKHGQETISKKGIIVPGENATQEEKEKFMNALGRPEKPEGYKLSEVKDLHPSIKVTPESQKSFLEAAHKMGFSNVQADQIYQWYLQQTTASLKNQEASQIESINQAKTALSQEWGKDYEPNLKLASRLVEKVGGKEALDAFGDLGSNPTVLKVLHKLGKMVSEDNIKDLGFSSLEVSAKDAQRKIDEIKANKSHAWWNENDPNHGKAVQEMKDLYQHAYGEAK